MLLVGDVLGSLEHHVLEEVREAGLARLLVGLQRFANSIPFENLETAQQQLEIANAFSDPDEGKLKFV